LIKVASGFEAVTQVRAHNLPTFADTVPDRHIQGTKLQPPRRQNARPVVPPVTPRNANYKMPHNI
jgi:hypothetical protein